MIDTQANLKTRLGVTGAADDALLTLLQDSADAVIDNYCDRAFAGGTYTEYLPGGSEFLHVRNYPVDTVTSVKVDPTRTFGPETLVAANTYVVHADRGVVQSVVGPFLPGDRNGLVNAEVRLWTSGPRIVQIVYSVLTGQVPNDVKEAYARLVGHWYRKLKTETANAFVNLSEQKFGDAVAVYSGGELGAVPADVAQLLAPYRTPHV